MDGNKPDDQLIFGYPEEWADFRIRHALFLQRFPHISDVIHEAFTRVIEEPEPIERFVMLYGRLCVEDFFEIMSCCGNGYGFAALKLLRGLYERAVTLDYLNDHPDELDAFVDYGHVSDHKLFRSVTEVFGPSALSAELQDVQEEVERNYERVKESYMVADCVKCGTKRLNISWTKLTFPAMARQTRILGKLIQSAYYIPMRHTHSTIASLSERLEFNNGATGFNPDAQRPQADNALHEAHTIVLEVLQIQQKRFKIEGFDLLYDKCVEDWKEIYGVDDMGNRTRPSEDSPQQN
jgi:hypothetical protein